MCNLQQKKILRNLHMGAQAPSAITTRISRKMHVGGYLLLVLIDTNKVSNDNTLSFKHAYIIHTLIYYYIVSVFVRMTYVHLHA